MTLTHLPLLQVQRDLYALPRGMERFREYIRTDRAGFALALHDARVGTNAVSSS